MKDNPSMKLKVFFNLFALSKNQPDGEVLHDLGEVLQLRLQLLEGDGAALVFVGGLKQRQRQVVQLLLRQRDGALTQTRLQNDPQLIGVDGAAA